MKSVKYDFDTGQNIKRVFAARLGNSRVSSHFNDMINEQLQFADDFPHSQIIAIPKSQVQTLYTPDKEKTLNE